MKENTMAKYIVLIITLCIYTFVFGQKYQLESSEDCATCHENIYNQWIGSMHAKSTLDKDILYNAMYTWAMKDTKGKIAQKCKNCHYPYYFLEDTTESTQIDKSRPVDCLYCHAIGDIHKAPVFSEKKYSSENNTNSDYHIIEKRDHYTNEKICMLCHAELSNPKNVPICITGNEYYNQNTSKQSCQSCHMPVLQGLKSSECDSSESIRAHTFVGPHNKDFLYKSLKLYGHFNGDTLNITVDNSEIPHGYPTGTPLRMVLLKVIGFDENNKIIYQNWKVNPVVEDQQAVFARLFEDEENNFPVPPWRASNVKIDTRLKPQEIRNIKYEVPVSVKSVSAKVFFLLAPIPILNQLKIDDPYLRTAHLIDQIEIEVN